jgi:hypothetical protein
MEHRNGVGNKRAFDAQSQRRHRCGSPRSSRGASSCVRTLGIPVVLVYLGFLDADEMRGGVFGTPEDWRACVLAHAEPTVPKDVWETRVPVGTAWVVPLIRAARMSAQVVSPA